MNAKPDHSTGRIVTLHQAMQEALDLTIAAARERLPESERDQFDRMIERIQARPASRDGA